MMIFCSLLQFSMMEFGSWEIKFSLKVFRWILMTYFPKSWHGWLSIRCQGVLQVALKYSWLWPNSGPFHRGFWLKSILTLPLDLCSHPLLHVGYKAPSGSNPHALLKLINELASSSKAEQVCETHWGEKKEAKGKGHSDLREKLKQESHSAIFWCEFQREQDTHRESESFRRCSLKR